ncbi:hypothetical protein [Rubrobacter marinus]|nr:hypothetical protein [Rubrobacter marinus]
MGAERRKGSGRTRLPGGTKKAIEHGSATPSKSAPLTSTTA